MQRASIFVVAGCAFGLLAVHAYGAGWKGAAVMPKNAKFQLENNGSVTATVYDIGWPAVVERTEGRNLFITDEGGYGQKPVSGWVYSEDVVKLDGAREGYTKQLEEGGRLSKTDKAVLYWLRGIAWESQQELEIANLDYEQAASLGLPDQLDDVELRLGRLTMLSVLQNGAGQYDPRERDQWESHYRTAFAMYQRTHGADKARPQLFLDWAASLGLACRCTLNKPGAESVPKPASDDKPTTPADTKPAKSTTGPSKAQKTMDPGSIAGAGINFSPEADQLHKSAMGCLDTAAKLNPFWWRVPFSRGEILLARCERETDEGEMLPAPAVAAGELLQASRYFSQAIALNPKSPDCYRDRAEVLRLEQRYAEAKDSAKIACDMTLNRQPQCLRTMAQIYAELKDYPNAIRFAHRAVEYSPETRQKRLSALFNKYIATYQDTTMDANVALDFVPQSYVAWNDPEKPRGGPAPTIVVPSRSFSAFGQ
jgi:tetratricopeptide (TPR) repeat protein